MRSPSPALRNDPVVALAARGVRTILLGAAMVAAVGLSAVAVRAEGEGGATKPEAYPCVIEARQKIKVSASVTGVIEKVFVDRGDRVKAGDPLVELESSVERAQVDLAEGRARNGEAVHLAEAKVEATRKILDRFDKLRRINGTSVTAAKFEEVELDARLAEINLRDARSTFELSGIEAERARAQLRQRRIVSPVDGVVVERLMAPGEYRNEQSQILTLVAVDPLHVEVFLPVALYARVKAGSTAVVMPAAPIGGEHEAKVKVVDSVIDAPSGTFGVRLELPNPAMAIPAGLRCTVRFSAGG